MWAMAQDGTGKTAKELANMSDLNLRLTALLRARYYKIKSDAAEKAQQGGR